MTIDIGQKTNSNIFIPAKKLSTAGFRTKHHRVVRNNTTGKEN
jgi:hypothetical protein